MLKSINVRVDDYLPPSETYRPKDPHVVSVLENEKTLKSLNDTLPSNDVENEEVSQTFKPSWKLGTE